LTDYSKKDRDKVFTRRSPSANASRANMRADAVHAYTKGLRNFLVGCTVSHKRGDLVLSWREFRR
jgi:hypothetical protein